MSEEIMAVFIPGRMLSNNESRNGEMDFLFMSKDFVIKNIKNDDEFVEFKDNIDSYKFEINQEKEEEHIQHIVDYLNKNFKLETRTIDLSVYEPHNSYILYRILAKNGNIIIINSQVCSIGYFPSIDMITKEQIENLQRLSQLINPEISFECEFVKTLKDIDHCSFNNFGELLDEITNKKVMR